MRIGGRAAAAAYKSQFTHLIHQSTCHMTPRMVRLLIYKTSRMRSLFMMKHQGMCCIQMFHDEGGSSSEVRLPNKG